MVRAFAHGAMGCRMDPSWCTHWAIYFDYFEKEGRKEMFYLTTHSTHFLYGYMALDIW